MITECIKEEPEEDEESTCGALLNVNVRISGDHTKTLSIYENDIIEERVEKFCFINKLNDKMKAKLTQQVIIQLDSQIIELEQSQKNTQSSNHSSSNYNEMIDNQFKQSFGEYHQQPNLTEGCNHKEMSAIKAEVTEINYTEPQVGSFVVVNKKIVPKKQIINKCSSPSPINKKVISSMKNSSKSRSKSKSKDSIKIGSSKPLDKVSLPKCKPIETKNSNSTLKTIKLPNKKMRNSPSPPSNPLHIKAQPLSPLPKPKKSLRKSNSHQSIRVTRESIKTPKMHKRGQRSPLQVKKEFSNKSLQVMQMKILKYKEIFDILDSDNDGFISSKKINLSVISKDLLRAFTPILGELQKTEMKMSFKEFCIRVDKILSVLSCKVKE